MKYDFEIVTDSSCNLTEEYIDKYSLNVLSLTFHVGEKEYYSYIKGETFDYANFYSMLRKKESVTTSLVSMESCYEMYGRLLSEGKDVLYIGFSSGLSGTYSASAVVLKELAASYPERKIYYMDTLSATLAQGILVCNAVKLREEGKSIEEVYEWLMENRLNSQHWLTVDDLFFLLRGGRLSATSAVAGSLLNVKPIITVNSEGKLNSFGKIRGRKKSLDALVDHFVEKYVPTDGPSIGIAHGDCLEDAQYVERQIRQRLNVGEIISNYVEPVIASHTGPGLVGVFFLGAKR